MIKAIIFDCFGVLAEDGWLPFKRKYIGDNTELSRQIVDLGKQNEYGMLSNDDYFASAAQLIGVGEPELRNAVGRKVPNVDLFSLISNFEGRYKIGLLTNANYDVMHNLFEPSQADLIDASVMSFESRLVKPDPRAYQLIASRLGVNIDECLYVDDIERYCMAAEDQGMKSVHYTDFIEFESLLKAALSANLPNTNE